MLFITYLVASVDINAVVAIDFFKGSLSSLEAGRAAKEGINRVYDDAYVVVSPLADGGEGTVEALSEGMNGEIHTVTVTGPLGKEVDCENAKRNLADTVEQIFRLWKCRM